MSTTMSWIILFLAGFLEICWAIGLKYTHGFTKLYPSVFTIIALALSMYLLARASSVLPIGAAYGVWVGIGAVGTGILGMILFNEPVTLARIFFLGLLLIAIFGLKINA